jgi:hypothetical protein
MYTFFTKTIDKEKYRAYYVYNQYSKGAAGHLASSAFFICLWIAWIARVYSIEHTIPYCVNQKSCFGKFDLKLFS